MDSVYTISVGAVPGKGRSCESSVGILGTASWAALKLICAVINSIKLAL